MYISEIKTEIPENFSCDTEEQAFNLLKSCQIPFEWVQNDVVNTMEECKEIDQALGTEIRKTIFLRNKKKTAMFLVILPAEKHLDTSIIEKKLGVSRLSFASAELMEEYLHTEPGSASIMNLIHDPDEDIQLILDREVADSEWFGCNTGTNTAHLKFRTQDLLQKLIPKLRHRVEIMDL